MTVIQIDVIHPWQIFNIARDGFLVIFAFRIAQVFCYFRIDSMNEKFLRKKMKLYLLVTFLGMLLSIVSCTQATSTFNTETSPSTALIPEMEESTILPMVIPFPATPTPFPTMTPTVTTKPVESNHLTLLNTYEIQALYFDYFPDSQKIAFVQEEEVVIFDLSEKRVVSELMMRSSEVIIGIFAFAVSTDGAWIAASNYDGLIYIWNATDGSLYRKLGFFTQPTFIQFSQDGALLAAGSGGEIPGLSIWNVEQEKEIGSFNNYAADIAFLPTGGKFATTDLIWQGTGPLIHFITLDTFDDQVLFEITEPLDEIQAVHSLSFAPTGQQLAAVINRSLRIWNMETWEEIPWPALADLGPLHTVDFAPNGLLVTVDINEKISILDPSNGELIGVIENMMKTGLDTNVPLRVAFSPDGTKIMTGGRLAYLQEWRMPK